jgi:hypothetical protein
MGITVRGEPERRTRLFENTRHISANKSANIQLRPALSTAVCTTIEDTYESRRYSYREFESRHPLHFFEELLIWPIGLAR